MLKPSDQQTDKASEQIPVTETPDNFDSFKRQIGHMLPTSLIDSLNATAKQSLGAGSTGDMFIHSFDSERIKANEPEGAKIDPDLLNRIFPGVENPFTQPTTLDVAKDIALKSDMRSDYNSVIENGPKGPVYGLSRFAAGFIPAMFDPVAIGAGVITAGAAPVLARAAGLGAESFLLAENPTVAQSFARHFVENTGAMSALEMISNAKKAANNEDYSLTESLANIVGGSAIGAGIGVGAPVVMKYLRGIGGSAAEVAEKSAVAQLAQGKEVDVNPIVEQAVRDRLVRPPAIAGVGEYIHDPIVSAEQMAGRPFFSGSSKTVGTILDLARNPIEGEYGKGIYLTDNAHVANGMAAGTFAEADGKIMRAEIKTEGLNTISLDQPLPEPLVRQAAAELRKAGLEGMISSEDLKNSSGKEIMQLLQSIPKSPDSPSAIEVMQARAQAEGIDGYTSQGGHFLGVDGQSHNMVMLFDKPGVEDRIVPGEEMKPNRDLVPQPQYDKVREQALERQGVTKDIGYDAQKFPEFKRLIQEPPKEMALPDLEKTADQAMEQIKSLKEQGLLSPEHEQALEAYSEIEKRSNDLEKAIKAATFCRGKDI